MVYDVSGEETAQQQSQQAQNPTAIEVKSIIVETPPQGSGSASASTAWLCGLQQGGTQRWQQPSGVAQHPGGRQRILADSGAGVTAVPWTLGASHDTIVNASPSTALIRTN